MEFFIFVLIITMLGKRSIFIPTDNTIDDKRNLEFCKIRRIIKKPFQEFFFAPRAICTMADSFT